MPSPSSRHKALEEYAFYGWWVVLVCVLARGAKSWGQANVLLFVIPSVQHDLSLSGEAMSLVFLASTITGAVLQLPFGRLVDRAGARACMTWGLLLLGGGMLFFAYISEPGQLYFAFLALRASFAVDLFVDQCISQWFDQYRGRALAASNVGSQFLGGMMASEAAEWITSNYSWRHCYNVAGFTCFLVAVPVLVVVRRCPGDLGLLPDGALAASDFGDADAWDDGGGCLQSSVQHNRVASTVLGSPACADDLGAEHATDGVIAESAALAETKAAAPSRKAVAPSSWTCAEAFRTYSAWAFLFIALADGYIGASSTFHRLAILAGEGSIDDIEFDVAAWVNIPNSIVYIIVVFAAGVLLDKGVEPRYLLLASSASNLLCILALIARQPISASQGLLHGMLQGFNWGMSMTVKAAAYASFFGRDHIGSIYGVEKFVNITGTAIGPAALSMLQRVTGSLTNALAVSAVLPLTAGVLLCFARRPQHPYEVLAETNRDCADK